MQTRDKKILYKLSIPRLSALLETNISSLLTMSKQDMSEDNSKKLNSLIKFGNEIVYNLKRYAVSDMRCSISFYRYKRVNNKSLINSIINQVFTFLMSTISIRSSILQSTSNTSDTN